MRQLGGKFLVHFAPAKLRRFRRNEYRLERFLRIRLKQFRQLLSHFFSINISGHDESQIVRDVARFVILHHLLLGELIVDFDLADDREPIGMPLISGCKKKQPSHAIWIIHAHGKLAANDFLFFLIFLRRQSGIHHRIGQNVERGRDAIFRHVDPKNRAIKRSVRVDVTAHALNFLRDLIGRSGLCSLEEHVLENVGQARAEVLVFVDASRGAPSLHACHRRAAIFLNDDRQPVRQDPFLRRARRKVDDRQRFSRRSLQINHTEQ